MSSTCPASPRSPPPQSSAASHLSHHPALKLPAKFMGRDLGKENEWNLCFHLWFICLRFYPKTTESLVIRIRCYAECCPFLQKHRLSIYLHVVKNKSTKSASNRESVQLSRECTATAAENQAPRGSGTGTMSNG